MLGCYRYIELNPIRAGMVRHARDYPWSSYRSNAEGKASGLIKPHRLYQRLGLDEEERRLAYRALFKTELDPEVVAQIRRTTNGGYVLGNPRFLAQVEAALGRRAASGKAGRPKKGVDD